MQIIMNDTHHMILILLIISTAIMTACGLDKQSILQRYQFDINKIIQQKQYYRLISSAFLHVGWMHFLFNMLTLYFFSSTIILMYGIWVFLILYFGSVLAGNLFTLWLYKNRPSYCAVGASGGVSGILCATIVIAPLQTIFLYFIPITAWIFATLYFAYSVSMILKPQSWDNTGHPAHLGGAAFGMLFIMVLAPTLIIQNVLFISIMSLPLLYLLYELLINKRLR